MTRADGADVIAKIPCRISGPPGLTTAGEVGVLEYGMWFISNTAHGLREFGSLKPFKSGDTRASLCLVFFHGHPTVPMLWASSISSWRKLLAFLCFKSGAR